MMRGLLSALLLFSFNSCDHEIGQDDPLPSGVTSLGTEEITEDLRGVFAVSDTEVYVVGFGGTVARFDGERLIRLQIPGVTENDMLIDVVAFDTGKVVVSGGTPQETPLVFSLMDGQWQNLTERRVPTNFHVSGLHSTLHQGSKRVVLAGGTLTDGYMAGGAFTFDGSAAVSPVQLFSTYGYLSGVTSIGDTLFFDHEQGILAVNSEREDLSRSPSPYGTNLVGLLQGADRYLLQVSDHSLFTMLNGGAWSVSTRNEGPNAFGLDGRAVNDLYAVGTGGTFSHYDGTGWTSIASGTEETLMDVHVLPNGNVYAVGEGGTFLRYVP